MKYLLPAALLTFYVAAATAATPIPRELAGIWDSRNAQFHDRALSTGQAIYLGADGNGATIGGKSDGAHAAIVGVRLAVTSYASSTHVIAIDLSDGSRHMSGQLPCDTASARQDAPRTTPR